MKIVKIRKCASCGVRADITCEHSMMNGCSRSFCFVCWPSHSEIHDKEWQAMSDAEKDAIIQRRHDDG